MILRLPIQVILYKKSQAVLFINSTKKSQVKLRLHGLSRSEWDFGVCRVWYARPDFWNEFRFTNAAQLEDGLSLDTERPLIDYLLEVIPAQYLAKRQLSQAQRQAIRKARGNSPMGAL